MRYSRIDIMSRQCIRHIIVMLCLAVVLAAGCFYAYTRDLYKGNNKIYVQPDDASGQVAVREDVVQTFMPGHDFDGVSLLIDHTRVADLGAVRVSVYRSADDALVMERALPVIVTTRERYTFFASNETIEADAGEAFYAIVTYEGPSAGLVTAATGEMPAEVASSCEVGGTDAGAALAIGVVTDYQYDVRNCWLIVIADVLFVMAVGVLALWWKELRGNTRRGKAIFLAVYYAIMTSLFLFSLTMTSGVEYTAVKVDEEATGTVSLRDGESIDAYITLPEDNICGMQIPVERPPYAYINEKVTIQILSANSGQILQTNEIPIADSADYSGGILYLGLDDRYAAGTRLNLHITTTGMIYAESMQFATVDNANTDNLVYASGTLQNGQLSVEMYTTTWVTDYSRVIQLYVEAVIIGLVLSWLLLWKNTPLYIRKERITAESVSATNNKSSYKRTIAWLVATLLCGIVIIDYSWTHGIGCMQDKVDAELVSYSPDYEHDWREIPTASEITQEFIVEHDRFCGVALMIADSGLETTENIADAMIRVAISDEQGTVLDESEYRIDDLSLIGDMLAKDSDDRIASRGNMFYHIPIADETDRLEGTNLTLHIRADADNADAVMIAENDYDEIHLMTVYHRYAIMVPQFVISMAALLVAACILSVIASRRLANPIVSFVILAITGGVGLSLAIPTMSIADGMAHVKYLYLMSNQFTGVYDVAGPGRFYVIPADLSFYDNGAGRISLRYYANVIDGLFETHVQDGIYSGISSRTDLRLLATIWTYLPSLLGFHTAQTIGFTGTTAAMIGKWCNLLVALMLICYAIHKTPVGKYGWMIVALFPGLMQYLVSVSYDAMINAFTFLYIGNALHLLYERDRSCIDYMITMLAAVLLLSNKNAIYLPIVCIIFIPVIRRLLRLNKTILIAGGGVTAIATIVVGMHHANGITSYTGAYTMADLLHDPMHFVHLVENTFVMRGDYIITHIVGSGLNSREAMEPKYVVVFICILLYLSWRGEPDNSLRSGKKAVLYIGVLAVANVLLLCLAWYLLETERTDVMIRSLSGKYLNPIVILSNVVGASIVPHRPVISQQRILHLMSLVYMVCVSLIYVYVFGAYGV